MPFELWQGLLIPFAGTTLGAACVFFMRNNLSELVQRALTGFGAMVLLPCCSWILAWYFILTGIGSADPASASWQLRG